MYKTFTNMPVGQKAHILSIQVFNITIDLPKSEDYGLTSQIRRSANSVLANIAEGFRRRTKKDKSYFYVRVHKRNLNNQIKLLLSKNICIDLYPNEYTEDVLYSENC